ncbi:helix-turn-helix domain-containing protein [Nocardioides yefusunii]|uniref:Helix-turn-helix domain-containing protein n=1 Tax=Nocardioides yefusunii TaxID=2500546 RepID=A0ABW1QYI7_9ACTN|nr:helix-turn-helix domain-containing protein [Nocardioides yefusunii]
MSVALELVRHAPAHGQGTVLPGLRSPTAEAAQVIRPHLMDGRVVAIIDGPELQHLAALAARTDSALQWRGQGALPWARDLEHAAGMAKSVGASVPLPEPRADRTPLAEQPWSSTAEAARLLGISERAVRKRITTGSLRGSKVAGRWLVNLIHSSTRNEGP